MRFWIFERRLECPIGTPKSPSRPCAGCQDCIPSRDETERLGCYERIESTFVTKAAIMDRQPKPFAVERFR